MTGDRIQVRRGTAAEWAVVDPVLADGEIAYDRTNNSLKIGDGATPWSARSSIGGVVDTSTLERKTRVDVREYGAVGDAVTDDTAAIQAALDVAAATNAPCHFPGLTFVTSTTLRVSCEISSASAAEVVSSASVAFQLGEVGTTLAGMTLYLPRVLRSTASPHTGTGIKLVDVDNCFIVIPWVHDFADSVTLAGDSQGVAYNTLIIGRLFGYTRNMVFAPVNGGWSNQNTIIGGRWAINQVGTNIAGVRQIDIVDGNANTFLGCSIEGGQPEYHIRGVNAVQNHFYGLRFETQAPTVPKVHWDEVNSSSYSTGNLITDSFTSPGRPILLTQSANANRNHVRDHVTWRGEMGNDDSDAMVLSNRNSDGESLLSIISSTLSPHTADANVDYKVWLGAGGIKLKNTTDAYPRTYLDAALGRLYFGDGANDPTSSSGVRLRWNSALEVLNQDVFCATAGKGFRLPTNAKIVSGTGSPEGAVSAVVGSLYLRSDGTAGSLIYEKRTGSGTTGWSTIGTGNDTVINVLSYGAVGNGSTNDTSAINAALTAATAGQTVLFPAGKTFLVTGQLAWSSKRLHLSGAGATILQGASLTVPVLLGTDVDGSTVTGLTITGSETAVSFDGADSNRVGIQFTSTDGGQIADVTVTGKSFGVRLDACNSVRVVRPNVTGFATSAISGVNFHSAVDIQSGNGNAVTDLSCVNIGSGVLNRSSATRTRVSGGFLSNTWDNGVYVSSGNYCSVTGVTVATTAGVGVKVRGNGHIVSGNVCTDALCGIEATGNGSADSLGANGHGTVVVNNVIENTTRDGVLVGSQDGFYPRHFTVADNTITNTATEGGGYAAIRAAMDYPTIRGNRIHICGGTTAAIILAGDAAFPVIPGVQLVANAIDDSAGDGFRISRVSGGVIADNAGTDLAGDLLDLRTVTNTRVTGNQWLSGVNSQFVVRTDSACSANVIAWNDGNGGTQRSVSLSGNDWLIHLDDNSSAAPNPIAKVGSLWLRSDGGAGSTLYTKESGDNSTSGWVPHGAASGVANTPAGSIAATTVQDAINELDAEKAGLASPSFTGTVSVSSAMAVGAAPASAGAIRLTNGIGINQRNGANDGDVTIIAMNSSNDTYVGSSRRSGFAVSGTAKCYADSSTFTITDAINVVVGTTTGSKIGTAASQKLGFWNATPVVQPSTTGTTTGHTAGAGTPVTADSTFTGGTGSKAYTIGDIVLALKAAGIMAAS